MKRDPALVPVVAALWLALGVFIIYPFIRLLAVTFTAEDGGLSLENLTMVFSNSYDRLALMNSIWLAIAVAVTGTALGFCFAFAVVRIKMPAIAHSIILLFARSEERRVGKASRSRWSPYH